MNNYGYQNPVQTLPGGIQLPPGALSHVQRPQGNHQNLFNQQQHQPVQQQQIAPAPPPVANYGLAGVPGQSAFYQPQPQTHHVQFNLPPQQQQPQFQPQQLQPQQQQFQPSQQLGRQTVFSQQQQFNPPQQQGQLLVAKPTTYKSTAKPKHKPQGMVLLDGSSAFGAIARRVAPKSKSVKYGTWLAHNSKLGLDRSGGNQFGLHDHEMILNQTNGTNPFSAKRVSTVTADDPATGQPTAVLNTDTTVAEHVVTIPTDEEPNILIASEVFSTIESMAGVLGKPDSVAEERELAVFMTAEDLLDEDGNTFNTVLSVSDPESTQLQKLEIVDEGDLGKERLQSIFVGIANGVSDASVLVGHGSGGAVVYSGNAADFENSVLNSSLQGQKMKARAAAIKPKMFDFTKKDIFRLATFHKSKGQQNVHVYPVVKLSTQNHSMVPIETIGHVLRGGPAGARAYVKARWNVHEGQSQPEMAQSIGNALARGLSGDMSPRRLGITATGQGAQGQQLGGTLSTLGSTIGGLFGPIGGIAGSVLGSIGDSIFGFVV